MTSSYEDLVEAGYGLMCRHDLEGTLTWVNKAIENLGQALDGGFQRVAELRMDPDLTPIRRLPEFEKMIER